MRSTLTGRPKDPDAAIPLLRGRVMAIIPHFQGLITYWDVLNEANAAANYPDTGTGAWIKRDGPAPVVQTALGWAREAAKGQNDTLLYNDYETGDANVALLTALQKQNALPDAIGIQSHMHSGPWPISKVWQIADRFAKFGKPVHFTETTVISGPRRDVDYKGPAPTDWLTTPEDEKAQADYLVDFYSVLFSHPALRAITYWDFSDHDAWLGAPAGLVRRDMSPKPAYDRLLELIHKTWWTDAQGQTDSKGVFRQHAFYGTYTLTVTAGTDRTATQTIEMPMGSAAKTVVLTLP